MFVIVKMYKKSHNYLTFIAYTCTCTSDIVQVIVMKDGFCRLSKIAVSRKLFF